MRNPKRTLLLDNLMLELQVLPRLVQLGLLPCAAPVAVLAAGPGPVVLQGRPAALPGTAAVLAAEASSGRGGTHDMFK